MPTIEAPSAARAGTAEARGAGLRVGAIRSPDVNQVKPVDRARGRGDSIAILARPREVSAVCRRASMTTAITHRLRTYQTLSDALFPQRTLVRDAALVLVGALFFAATAQVSIKLPVSPVPISGITLGVLVVGGLLGARLGAVSSVLYL